MISTDGILCKPIARLQVIWQLDIPAIIPHNLTRNTQYLLQVICRSFKELEPISIHKSNSKIGAKIQINIELSEVLPQKIMFYHKKVNTSQIW